MLFANSFDLWQRDSFFSAAEEVQESTDILESAYRNWVRQKREGILLSDLDELRREVQTALGTAKWQLEEFERAVNQSYGNCRDQNKMARHQQFIVAIRTQISRVEDTMRETLNEEGKQQFRWVNLNEDERDDLAMFLTGSSKTLTKNHEVKVEENLSKINEACSSSSSSSSNFSSMASNLNSKGSPNLGGDVVINIGQSNSRGEFSEREGVGNRGEINNEAERIRGGKRSHVSTSCSSLKIVIPNEVYHMRNVEATPKEKGVKSSSLLQFRAINFINKLLKSSDGSNNKMQSSRRIQFNTSMRLIIIFMLSFFLLVPYFIHSN